MDRNAARLSIDSQLDILCAQRDAEKDPANKAALNRAIKSLVASRNAIDVAANDAIGATIDALVTQLNAVQTQNGTDAASAIQLAVRNFQDARRSS